MTLDDTHIPQLRAWAAEGHGPNAIRRKLAAMLGQVLSAGYVVEFLKEHGIRPSHKARETARNQKVVEKRRAGMTMAAIANDFQISRERVRQILDHHVMETGELKLLGDAPRKKKPPTVFRLCPACGASIHIRGRAHCSSKCRSAAVDQRNEREASEIIERRLKGESWRSILNFLGRPKSNYPSVYRLAEREIERRGKPELAAIVFPIASRHERRFTP